MTIKRNNIDMDKIWKWLKYSGIILVMVFIVLFARRFNEVSKQQHSIMNENIARQKQVRTDLLHLPIDQSFDNFAGLVIYVNDNLSPAHMDELQSNFEFYRSVFDSLKPSVEDKNHLNYEPIMEIKSNKQ